MGQEISAIISNQPLEIDKETVHFIEGACMIIPLDINPEHINRLVREAAKFDRIEELLAHLEANHHPERNNADRSDPGADDYGHSLKTAIEQIRSLKLQNFVLHYHSDFASMPTDAAFILILDGAIIKESVMIAHDGIDWDAYEIFAQQIGLNPRWFNDEARYFRYSNAEEVYRDRS